MNPAVSKYMSALQRKSADSRWGGMSAEARRAKMSAIAKARWAKRPKTKRARLRQNAPDDRAATETLDANQRPERRFGRSGG